jgi:hypothetical protein
MRAVALFGEMDRCVTCFVEKYKYRKEYDV